MAAETGPVTPELSGRSRHRRKKHELQSFTLSQLQLMRDLSLSLDQYIEASSM
ncbi:hypothetical protein HispidOSU_014709 [Sigmodon hispidus]